MIDPYLSLLVGAFGAALIGLFGAWIQSRREHSRWIRERRYDAYGEFLDVAERLGPQVNRAPRDSEIEEQERFGDALNRLRLVGPDEVWFAAWDYWRALMEYSVGGWTKKNRRKAGIPESETARPLEELLKELIAERQRFVDAAQRAVGISYSK